MTFLCCSTPFVKKTSKLSPQETVTWFDFSASTRQGTLQQKAQRGPSIHICYWPVQCRNRARHDWMVCLYVHFSLATSEQAGQFPPDQGSSSHRCILQVFHQTGGKENERNPINDPTVEWQEEFSHYFFYIW